MYFAAALTDDSKWELFKKHLTIYRFNDIILFSEVNSLNKMQGGK